MVGVVPLFSGMVCNGRADTDELVSIPSCHGLRGIYHRGLKVVFIRTRGIKTAKYMTIGPNYSCDWKLSGTEN